MTATPLHPRSTPSRRTPVLLLEAALAEVRPGDRVLEVGTGSGHIAASLAGRAARVVALDINPHAVRAARASESRDDPVRSVCGSSWPLRPRSLQPAVPAHCSGRTARRLARVRARRRPGRSSDHRPVLRGPRPRPRRNGQGAAPGLLADGTRKRSCGSRTPPACAVTSCSNAASRTRCSSYLRLERGDTHD